MSQQRHAVLITGGRDYDNEVAADDLVRSLPEGTLIVHGHATGADTLVDIAAGRHGYPTAGVPYFHWLGKAGGHVRNRMMVDLVCALRNDGWLVKVAAFPGGRGTANCVKQAEAANLPVQHVG